MKRTYRKVCSKCDGDGYISEIDWGYTIAFAGLPFLFSDHKDHRRCKVCSGDGYIIVCEEG